MRVSQSVAVCDGVRIARISVSLTESSTEMTDSITRCSTEVAFGPMQRHWRNVPENVQIRKLRTGEAGDVLLLNLAELRQLR